MFSIHLQLSGTDFYDVRLFGNLCLTCKNMKRTLNLHVGLTHTTMVKPTNVHNNRRQFCDPVLASTTLPGAVDSRTSTSEQWRQ